MHRALGVVALALSWSTVARAEDPKPDLARYDTTFVTGLVGFHGARGITTGLAGTSQDSTLGAAMKLDYLHAKDAWISRSHVDGAIGGGSAGADGLLRGSFGYGPQLPVAESAGPFARLGAGGQIASNQRTAFSYLEVPRGDLGYEVETSGDRFEIEVGLRGAALLAGRFRADGDARVLGAHPDAGAFVLVGTNQLRFDAEARRVFDASQTPVDFLDGSACYALILAVCLDASHVRGAIRGAPASATTLALTIGFGFIGPPPRNL